MHIKLSLQKVSSEGKEKKKKKQENWLWAAEACFVLRFILVLN